MGSITLASHYTNQKAPAYKISKTALNMLTVQYALEFGKDGLIFVLVNPGVSIPITKQYMGVTNPSPLGQWLQTDLCSTAADLPAGTGAKAVLEILHNASANDNGRFFNINVPTWTPQPGQNEYRGGTIPW